MEIAGALKMSNAQAESGSFSQADNEIRVETGAFLQDVNEVRNLMVGVHQGRPVYLRDVANIEDGSDELHTYTRFGAGPAAASMEKRRAAWPRARWSPPSRSPWPRRRAAMPSGSPIKSKACWRNCAARILPDGVEATITRNYGETANEKVNDLVVNLAMGILTVVGLIALTMGWREGIIVGLAIPITYSLTLLFNYMLGYTINRVTLFALILALGLLVDNPIVGVENISRFLSMKKYPAAPGRRRWRWRK